MPKRWMESNAYYIIYCLVGYTGYATIYTFSGVDSFFVTFCLYLSAVFKSIQYDIKKALSDLPQNDSEILSLSKQKLYKKRLAKIIQTHNDVIDLSQEFSSLFSLIVLGHFVSAALVLCISVMLFMLVSMIFFEVGLIIIFHYHS